MNEEEARKILGDFKTKPASVKDIAEFEYSKGYLNAIKKAKVLENALGVIGSGNMKPPFSRARSNIEQMQQYAKEAIAQWEKEK